MTQRSLTAGGLVALALTVAAPVQAAEYCTAPYLYATNIRSACEQLGADGMAALYESSRFIEGLRHTPQPAAAPAGAERAKQTDTDPAA